MKSKELLSVKNISIHFGGLNAVDQVNFDTAKGKISAIIGPNGAGKTTLFNLITGLYQPTEGKIFFAGEDITKKSVIERSKLGISRTFQNIRLAKNLTALENILAAMEKVQKESLWSVFGRGKRISERKREQYQKAEQLLALVHLEGKEEILAGNLAYGEQRCVEIARALATDCKLILLDEPAAGMNIPERKLLIDLIHHIADEMKISVVLIEHDLNLVMNVAEYVIVLDHGKKIGEGTPEQIGKNPEVIEAYIGKRKTKTVENTAAAGSNDDAGEGRIC